MPALFLISIVRLIVAAITNAGRKRKENNPRPLCTDCAHAHVQYAVNGRRAIVCTFAGTVRPVQIDVMYCTDFRDRNAAPDWSRSGLHSRSRPLSWRQKLRVSTAKKQKVLDGPACTPRLVGVSAVRAQPVHSIGVDRRGQKTKTTPASTGLVTRSEP